MAILIWLCFYYLFLCNLLKVNFSPQPYFSYCFTSDIKEKISQRRVTFVLQVKFPDKFRLKYCFVYSFLSVCPVSLTWLFHCDEKATFSVHSTSFYSVGTKNVELYSLEQCLCLLSTCYSRFHASEGIIYHFSSKQPQAMFLRVSQFIVII